MESEELISIKVCYAGARSQDVIALEIPIHSNVLSAIQCSNIIDKNPEIDLNKNRVGIFGSIVTLGHVLVDNDRIEIYRSLLRDPMQARRLRAESLK